MTGGPLWTRYSPRIDNETQCLGVGGIAVDSEDNVIVASNRDIIKYDPNGNVLWEYDLCGCGVAVDKTDNSIVVGLCNSSIIKFSKTGSIQKWQLHTLNHAPTQWLVALCCFC